MKCNKCLKNIPKGEEIRVYGRSGTYTYGGCYCEKCWKTKAEYEIYEGGNKTKENSNSEEMPSWGWFLIGFLLGTVIVVIFWWLFKKMTEE